MSDRSRSISTSAGEGEREEARRSRVRHRLCVLLCRVALFLPLAPLIVYPKDPKAHLLEKLPGLGPLARSMNRQSDGARRFSLPPSLDTTLRDRLVSEGLDSSGDFGTFLLSFSRRYRAIGGVSAQGVVSGIAHSVPHDGT